MMVPKARENMPWDVVAALGEAYDTMGDWEDVFFWMLQRQRAFGGVRPVEMLDDPEGCKKILTLFHQLATGSVV